MTAQEYRAARTFAQECYDASRALRRAPAAVKRDTRAAVRDRVAGPLADAIGRAATGPYARVLGPAVKVASDVRPRIRVKGKRKALSGGASVEQLVYGTEWGGGERVTGITRRKRNGGTVAYRRHTTRQFVPARPFIIPTIARERDTMLEAYAAVAEEALMRVIDGG